MTTFLKGSLKNEIYYAEFCLVLFHGSVLDPSHITLNWTVFNLFVRTFDQIAAAPYSPNFCFQGVVWVYQAMVVLILMCSNV